MKIQKLLTIFPVLLCLGFSSLTLPAVWAAEEGNRPKIAVLPFTVHAANDMSYIRSGLRDMISSRLAGRVGATIISRSLVDQAVSGLDNFANPDLNRMVGSTLSADYVLVGSLTAFAGATSIDAVLYPVTGSEGVRNFSVSAPTEGALIKAVDDLTMDIAEQAFSIARPVVKSVAQVAATPFPVATPASPYQSAHPDRIMMGGYGNGTAGNRLIRPMGVIGSPLGFTKTQNLSFGLVSMAVGDVDGDGMSEYILASRREVRIYRLLDRRMQQLASFPTPYNRYSIHAVTLADINNNGVNEIFVSIADAEAPLSYVIEWDGSQFRKSAENLQWYIRALEVPGEGMVLVGQKSSMNSLLASGLYRLALAGSDVIQGEKLPISGVNLFDFTLADIDADGKYEVIVISQDDKIMVQRPSGKSLWVSDEYYGGTTKYIGGESADDTASNLEHGHDVPRIYIPARILVRDVNKDGQLDVIINKNSSSASRMLSRYRSYPSGEIQALTWNGIGLTELWRTRKIDGYVADYDLGPTAKVTETDKEGKAHEVEMAELYVGLVLRNGGINILDDASSTVLTYPIEIVTGEK